MKLQLKDFQEEAVDKLVSHLRAAASEVGNEPQAVVLSAPTGSGKTLIATASIERIFQGDSEYLPNDEASILWLSDQPEINEQTRRKMVETSSILDESKLQVIDSVFDKERFDIGRVYFLNTQKLGKDKQLVTHGDERTHTIWETISNSVRVLGKNFLVYIDEAHRGMGKSARDELEAATIIQKFLKGSSEEIPPMPMVVGISATPQRFDRFIQATPRVRRAVVVNPEEVRASGLLKDIIKVYYPVERQPSDLTMLDASALTWKEFVGRWKAYCQAQKENVVRPILLVQVQDGTKDKVSNTDIGEAMDHIIKVAGPIPTEGFAHSFQEGTEIQVEAHKVRYLAPADIIRDQNAMVVFFKTSLNTGWDCPSAEVMMSFRKAIDSTLIAQLVGRMVRTPLARRIVGDEFLNSVSLYLPHYDQPGLNRVVDALTKPDSELMTPVDIVESDEMLTLERTPGTDAIFDALAKIPSYTIPKVRRASGVKRLMKLARLLANDGIRPDAVEEATDKLLKSLIDEYQKLTKTQAFKDIVESSGKIKVNSVDWQYMGEVREGETIELDVTEENLDEIFETAGRKLGEGLHKTWWKYRVQQDETAKERAKLEAVGLSLSPDVITKLERAAQTSARGWLDVYRLEINKLSESRKLRYNEVRQLASEPEVVYNTYPQAIVVRKGELLRKKHLYSLKSGEFPANLNEWETSVIDEEIPKSNNWLRNFDRKSWALAVPYKDGGSYKAMYPDFLVTKVAGGDVSIDLLDPHSTSLADAPAKASGLADYAERHLDAFGRIELLAKVGQKIRRLNLKDEIVRSKVKGVSSREHLLQLYAMND